MAEKHWYLKRNDLFGRLTDEQIKRLESRSRQRSFPAHSQVHLPSERAESVFLLASGLIKIGYLASDGKQSIRAFVEPGELFGELAVPGGPPHDEYVEAVKDSIVLMIPIEEIQRLVAASVLSYEWFARGAVRNRLRMRAEPHGSGARRDAAPLSNLVDGGCGHA